MIDRFTFKFQIVPVKFTITVIIDSNKMNRSLQSIHLRPLPPLLPINLPSGVLSLFPDPIQIPSLSLSAVPEEQHEEDETSSYRQLYQQKCEQQMSLRNRIKSHEEVIKILQQKNASLEYEVGRLQQQKWKRFDYSRLSARGRSKSQKRVAPTIDVKVPHRMNQNKQILIQQQKCIKTDRDRYNEDVSYYKQEIRQYKQENKQLKQQIEQLKLMLKERYPSKGESFPATSINKSKNAKSPQKEEYHHSVFTPIVSPFSPFPKESSETVKKQMIGCDQATIQLKKLKNQILYKELLLDKLRTEHAKQTDFLKKHLVLSVTESQKVAEQTTNILNSFKTEIIRLSQELLQYKRTMPTTDRSQKGDYDQRLYTQKDLMAILKTRRAEQITF